MINVKNIKIGSLLKVRKNPFMILKDTIPLKKWEVAFNLANLTEPLLLLKYQEGVDYIYSDFTRDIKHVFCTRILVYSNSIKFWIVINSTENINVIELPDDIKNSFRETGILELLEDETK